MKWVCKVCGYEHEGDTPPDECPICGAGPEDFEPVGAPAAPASPAPQPLAPATGAQLRCALCDSVLSDQAEQCDVCGSRTASLSAAPHVQYSRKAGARRYVVVGGGVAGFTAAERIRAVDPNGSIVLVTRESCLPYYRISITRYVGGELPASELFVHPASWWRDRGIELMLDTEALELDRSSHELSTSRGRLGYDRLIAATGARAFVPPLENGSVRNAMPLRTIHHAREVLARGLPGTRVVMVGGGVLGLEAAFGLARRGCEVTVCEGSPHLLPRQLDPQAAALFQGHLEKKGIRFALGSMPSALVGDEAVRGVRLASGSTLDAELVVLSAGIRPNNLLWQRAGLKTEKGLTVDDSMCTSDPDVFAAGDGAEHRGMLYGIWPASMEMGRVAGANAAGGSELFPGLPMSYLLKVVDLDLFSIGTVRATEPDCSELVRPMDAPNYQKLVLRNGVVIGAILLGDTALSGRVRDAVQQKRSFADMIAEKRSPTELFEALAGD